MKRGQFVSGLSNFGIDAIQAHEVAKRPEVKKYEGARFLVFFLSSKFDVGLIGKARTGMV